MIANERPRLHVAPRRDETFGDIAALFAGDYELTPDPWQRFVLDDWLAVTDDKWSSLTCGLACPRQNGKNGIIEVRELFGMVGRGEKILHTAHEVKTARKAFKRLQHFFGRQVNDPAAKFPELNELVVELRNVNGQEAIFLGNGGSVEIVARSKNSGRGFTADVLVLDEAQEMSDEDVEALMPTTSAAPLGNPQWIFTGTPPGPKANGEVFTRTRQEALGKDPGRICWHEWSACDPGESVDLDDRELWRSTNPALGLRLQLSVVEGERSRFSDEGFARERLGVWEEPDATSGGGIPADAWLACLDPDYDRSAPPRYGLEVDPDGTAASIGASDGTFGFVLEWNRGSTWVPRRLAEVIAERPGDLWLDPSGPAGALLSALTDAGLTWHEISRRQYAQACGELYAAVVEDHSFRHAGQPVLDIALKHAVRRVSGDAWVWDRRKPTTSVAPLGAITIARWAALQAADSPFFAAWR